MRETRWASASTWQPSRSFLATLRCLGAHPSGIPWKGTRLEGDSGFAPSSALATRAPSLGASPIKGGALPQETAAHPSSSQLHKERLFTWSPSSQRPWEDPSPPRSVSESRAIHCCLCSCLLTVPGVLVCLHKHALFSLVKASAEAARRGGWHTPVARAYSPVL